MNRVSTPLLFTPIRASGRDSTQSHRCFAYVAVLLAGRGPNGLATCDPGPLRHRRCGHRFSGRDSRRSARSQDPSLRRALPRQSHRPVSAPLRFHPCAGCCAGHQLDHSGGGGLGRSPREGRGPLTPGDATAGLPPWPTIAASPITPRPGRPTPSEMDRHDVDTVIKAWAWALAANRSLEVGFDICEIYGAHGYLLHQFFSPLTNHSNDGYGGDGARRMRLALGNANYGARPL